MKFEFSAGGIVYKKTRNKNSKILKQAFGSEVFDREAQTESAQARRVQDDIEVLVAQHSQHHGWVFPKGLIGDHVKGEKKEETAVREVEEETGIKAKIIKPLEPVTYWYQFEGQKIKKTVYYFLMEYVSGDIKKHDKEMENVEWLPVEEVEKRLTYKSDKEVWKQAKELIPRL